MENKKRWSTVFKNNMFLFKICFQVSPLYVLLYIMDVIRNDVVIFLEFTFGLNFILECAEFHKPFHYVLIYLSCLFVFVVIGMFFNSWLHEKYEQKVLPNMKRRMKQILYTKAKSVDLEYYDDPEYYNNFIFSISESSNQIEHTFTLINKMVSAVSTFILTGIFFLSEDILSLLFILVIFISSYIMSQIENKLNFNIRILRNQHERRRDYINRIFYLADYAKEIRVNTKLNDILLNDFYKENKEIFEIEKKNMSKRLIIDFIKEYVCNSFLHNIMYMAYLIYKAVVLHTISYSNVIVLFKAATKVKNSLHTFSTIYPFATEISLYVEKINCFLNTESRIKNGGRKVPEQFHKLELKHVYFSYTGDENYVLYDINMTINIAEKIAIVGFNGSGKTTLIKVIMRLYNLTKGEILLDGININEYDLVEYRRKIGVVFQDYKIYAASLLENVILGEGTKLIHNTVIDALKKGGFEERYVSLEKGLETPLTTEFEEEGVNLSGGESQKVAISRAIYMDNPLTILDEPSSALDPIAEYHMNKVFLRTDDNIVIFISHRLTTTRFSDVIYVLEKGRIVESGTHYELLEKQGVYAQMWNVQASHYVL